MRDDAVVTTTLTLMCKCLMYKQGGTDCDGTT